MINILFMKKQILLIGFLLVAVAGFSQMTKTDAIGFLARNPIENADGFIIWNGTDKTEWAKESIVSLKAMESGFSLVVKQSGVNREKFYPYASFKLLSVNSANQWNADLRN